MLFSRAPLEKTARLCKGQKIMEDWAPPKKQQKPSEQKRSSSRTKKGFVQRQCVSHYVSVSCHWLCPVLLTKEQPLGPAALSGSYCPCSRTKKLLWLLLQLVHKVLILVLASLRAQEILIMGFIGRLLLQEQLRDNLKINVQGAGPTGQDFGWVFTLKILTLEPLYHLEYLSLVLYMALAHVFLPRKSFRPYSPRYRNCVPWNAPLFAFLHKGVMYNLFNLRLLHLNILTAWILSSGHTMYPSSKTRLSLKWCLSSPVLEFGKSFLPVMTDNGCQPWRLGKDCLFTERSCQRKPRCWCSGAQRDLYCPSALDPPASGTQSNPTMPHVDLVWIPDIDLRASKLNHKPDRFLSMFR